MSKHTYFIAEDKSGTMLTNTCHLKNNPWMFKEVVIKEVLQTNKYEKAAKLYEKYIEENGK